MMLIVQHHNLAPVGLPALPDRIAEPSVRRLHDKPLLSGNCDLPDTKVVSAFIARPVFVRKRKSPNSGGGVSVAVGILLVPQNPAVGRRCV